jgi:hypothetical protein
LLSIKGHEVSREVFSLFALPGETVRIGLRAYANLPLQVSLKGRPVGERNSDGWELTAPAAPGMYPLRVHRTDNDDETLLRLWVMTPAAAIEGESLNGYRMGPYPPPRSNRRNYEPPAGFIEVTRENIDTRLSTNFTLRQFLCKQESDYPKYVVVQESLLLLLERLLVEVRSRGRDISTFGIISGYRTPWYNKRIGNVRYSRHVYGDAMDIFIDEDGDGRMDDLDRDGRFNAADIQYFYDLVNEVKARPENARLVGGVGRYNKTSRHGGFVHVDTRGYQARW